MTPASRREVRYRARFSSLALNVSAWHGSLQAAIRGIAENICSWRAFRSLTDAVEKRLVIIGEP
jgi:hypothetical protein